MDGWTDGEGEGGRLSFAAAEREGRHLYATADPTCPAPPNPLSPPSSSSSSLAPLQIAYCTFGRFADAAAVPVIQMCISLQTVRRRRGGHLHAADR